MDDFIDDIFTESKDDRYTKRFYEHDLEEACLNSDIDKVKLILSKGYQYDWNERLIDACSNINNINTDIIKLLISKGANNYDDIIRNICLAGNLQILKLLLTKKVYDLDKCLHAACFMHHHNLIKLLINKEANVSILDIYNYNKKEKIQLIENGISSNKFEILFTIFNKQKDIIYRHIDYYLISDLNNIVQQYLI